MINASEDIVKEKATGWTTHCPLSPLPGSREVDSTVVWVVPGRSYPFRGLNDV